MTATNHDGKLGEIYATVLVVHVFIAVAVMVMVCGVMV